MSDVPPDAFESKRSHPRFDVQAAVRVREGGDAFALPVRNLSLSGALLGNDGKDLTRFAVGSTISLEVYDPRNPARQPVPLKGRVVRHTGDGGMALMWLLDAGAVSYQLQRLLDQLRTAGPAR